MFVPFFNLKTWSEFDNILVDVIGFLRVGTLLVVWNPAWLGVGFSPNRLKNQIFFVAY